MSEINHHLLNAEMCLNRSYGMVFEPTQARVCYFVYVDVFSITNSKCRNCAEHNHIFYIHRKIRIPFEAENSFKPHNCLFSTCWKAWNLFQPENIHFKPDIILKLILRRK